MNGTTGTSKFMDNPAIVWSRLIITMVLSPAVLVFVALTLREIDQQTVINKVRAEEVALNLKDAKVELTAQTLTVQKAINDLWSSISLLREQMASLSPQEFRQRVERIDDRLRELEKEVASHKAKSGGT